MNMIIIINLRYKEIGLFSYKFRRTYSLLIALIFVFTLSACGSSSPSIDENATNNKQVIYASFFPVADLTSRIAGDEYEVKTIIGINEEPHSFELSANKMTDIKKSSLVVFNGATMESFMDDVEAEVGADKCLDLSQGLTLLKTKGSSSEEVVNPHTWLSVKCACVQLDTIYKKLSSIDPDNEGYYKQNLDKSLSEFEALDKKFEETIKTIPKDKRYFVVSHAAFNYLAHDYGLTQVAITGISPDEEPSAKQLVALSDFVEKHGINTIFFEGSTTPKVAQTLANSTDTQTSTLWTMENLNQDEADLGYLKLMEKNLTSLMRSF